MMRLSRIVALVTSGMLCTAPVQAQGALSTLGFGYPGGQLSTRALTGGGAFGEFDAQSPINPAALGVGIRSIAYVQYDPEFRQVTVSGVSAKTTTARFPVFGITGRFEDFTIGLSFSSFLDRSWTNQYADTVPVAGKPTPSRVSAQSTGGVSDVRLAAAWSLSPKLSVGAGLHLFPGENRVVLGRSFDDSLKIGSVVDASTISYSGAGVSLGVVGSPFEHFNLAASLRIGTKMQLRRGDSTIIGSGKVPMRYGLGVAYDGIAGAALMVRYSADKWTDLKGLGSSTLNVHDATELSAGAEFSGPKLAGYPLALRAGIRSRQLPFSPAADAVNEKAVTAGAGFQAAQGRFAVDIGAAYATRTAAGVRERGTTVSLGVSIRP